MYSFLEFLNIQEIKVCKLFIKKLDQMNGIFNYCNSYNSNGSCINTNLSVK